MKNKLIVLVACLLFGSVQLQAMDFDASVGMSSSDQKAVLRTPLTDDIDFLFGIGGYIPSKKNEEVSGKLNFGIGTDLPLLGATDLMILGSKPAGQGAVYTAPTLRISKTYSHNLNDQVSIGIKVVLTDITFTSSNKSATIIPEVYPVIGTTVSLF